jgi:hypothetical protein
MLSKDLVYKYFHCAASSTVHTAPPVFVDSLPGRSTRSLSHLPLHMYAVEIIPTFLTLNIYIGQCLPKALTPT